jgi:hypothetical protein
VDLLIIMPYKGSPLQQAARIIAKLNPPMAVDLLVRSPEEVKERLAMQDSLMREIMAHGQVAYEAEHAWVDQHNLYALLTLILSLEPGWQVLIAALNTLSNFAVAYRYPGITATKADARNAMQHCRTVRNIIRQTFGLPVWDVDQAGVLRCIRPVHALVLQRSWKVLPYSTLRGWLVLAWQGAA